MQCTILLATLLPFHSSAILAFPSTAMGRFYLMALKYSTRIGRIMYVAVCLSLIEIEFMLSPATGNTKYILFFRLSFSDLPLFHIPAPLYRRVRKFMVHCNRFKQIVRCESIAGRLPNILAN